MNFTKSRDGHARVSIHVPHRLAVGDLATYWVASKHNDGDDDYRGPRSRKELLGVVREHLRVDGGEHAFYRICDDNLETHVTKATVAIEEMFRNELVEAHHGTTTGISSALEGASK